MHPHVLDMLYFSFAQPIDSKHIADSPWWDMCDTASLRYSASLNAALRQWFRYRLMPCGCIRLCGTAFITTKMSLYVYLACTFHVGYGACISIQEQKNSVYSSLKIKKSRV